MVGGGINNFLRIGITEEMAKDILNENPTRWEGDFILEENTIDWDLINSEGIKIEVKSTISPQSFKNNKYNFHSEGQKKQIILFMLIDKENKLLKYKLLDKNKREIII